MHWFIVSQSIANNQYLITNPLETLMSKGQNRKKGQKKEAQKTMQEKKDAKRAKKNEKSQGGLFNSNQPPTTG